MKWRMVITNLIFYGSAALAGYGFYKFIELLIGA